MHPEERFRQIYARTYRKTAAQIMAGARQTADAADLIQEVYLELYQIILRRGAAYIKSPEALMAKLAKQALARYYRFINKETDMDVSLAAEVGHMENYIEIQQLRFGDKISVEKAELPDHVKNMSVPKLILQPIIENAYNYGLKDKLEGGLLRIEYQQQEQWLDIVIGDNGGAVTEEKLQQLRRQINTFEGDAANHAMTNINRRLQLSYGEEYGVKLDINEAGGLRVTLRLKISAV